MKNKANNKSIADESKAKGKDTSTGSNPLAGDDPVAEDMNADEMAMFNQIMGEIEGQEKTESQSKRGDEPQKTENLGSAPSATEHQNDPHDDGLDEDQQKAFESIMAQIESGDEPAPAETEDDFAAELEKVAKEAEAVTGNQTAPTKKEDADDGLDEDQQKALESIMAQIQGDDKSDNTKDSGSDGDEPAQAEAEDDFAAELEKVAKEAEAVTGNQTAPTKKEDADDELDEDQQKALESIMAQIQGDDKSDNTKDSGSDGDEPAQAEAEDDFAAELEKVAKEAEAVTGNQTAPTKKEDADDELDEDQQKALESIMAEIEGKSTKKTAADASKSPSTEAETKQVPQTKVDPAGDESHADADADDISDDIEDILKEITADFEESDDVLNEAKTDPDSLETNQGDDDIIVDSKPGDPDSEKSLPASVATEEKPVTSKTRSTAMDVPASKPAGNQVPEKAEKSQNKGAPLREVGKSRGIAKKAGIIVSMLAILSLALAGYGYWIHHRVSDPTPPSLVVQEPVQREPVTVVEASPPAPVTDAPSDQSGLKAIGDQIDGLRNELLAKREEIEALRDYYQAGIDAEVRSMVETLQKTGSGRFTLKTAMADPVISLGMKAIQRRDAYIKKLQNPANALYLNSEELFFLSRKAGLLALMADKTSDIDIEGFLKQAHVIMAAHRHALAQLNIDDVEVPVTDLESIWQRIDSQLSMKAETATPSSSATHTDNEAIWAAVCSGNFSQKHKLTELSPEAAHCLATWQGKDLFLNELTALSPAAARQLAAWEGDWLGLNGLTELSPETATYLAKWKGKGLSLNGLTRLSSRVVAILSEWQGDQIELINVKYMAHWENHKTRLFLSEEMSQKNGSKRQ